MKSNYNYISKKKLIANHNRGVVQIVRSDKLKEKGGPKMALYAHGVFPVINSSDVGVCKLNIQGQRKQIDQST